MSTYTPSALTQRNNRYSENLIVLVHDHPSLRPTRLLSEVAVSEKWNMEGISDISLRAQLD